LVDVMPVGTSASTYDDRWLLDAMAHAVGLELQPGLSIRHVTAPYFVALKLAAFADRGNGDYQASPDVGDIVQVLDGRPELAGEMGDADPDLLEYIALEFRRFLEDGAFGDSIPWHLPGDRASQARGPLVLERMSKIASLGRLGRRADR
jgi:hypothetical protein